MFMTSTLGTLQQVVEWCASKPSSPEVAAECGTHLYDSLSITYIRMYPHGDGKMETMTKYSLGTNVC